MKCAFVLLLFAFNAWVRSDSFTTFHSHNQLNFETVINPVSENESTENERKNRGFENSFPEPGLFDQSISGFMLVNAASDADIFSINNGDVISLASLPSTKLSIRANTAPESVGSVKFELTGPQVRTYTDNTAPYSLFGDDGSGNYYFGFWAPPAVGNYTLKATPYSLSSAKGTAGTPTTISFTIVENAAPAQDQVAPLVNSINRHNPTEEQTTGGTLVYRVLFSEAVSGVDISDFSLTFSGTASGTIHSLQVVNASTYDVSIENASGTGMLRLDMNAPGSAITDGSGNAITESFNSGATYNIAPLQDQTAPEVNSILRHIPAEQQTSGGTLVYRVLFSEAVTGVDATDFALTLDGSATGTISSTVVAIDAFTYEVSISGAGGTGTLRLDLNATGSGIIDAATNAITQNYTGGQVYNLAQSPPVQYTLNISESENGTVSKSPEQATYNEGSSVSITAEANNGYVFSGWIGDASGNSNPLSIIMNSNKSVSATFTSTSTSQSITSFVLVNASADVDLQTVTNGSVIKLASLPTAKLSMRVNTSPVTVGSVKFEMTGPVSRNYTDNNAPYSLFGDDGSSNFYYGSWNPPPLGAYTLTVTPYSGSSGSGTAGTPTTISFTIVENEAPQNDQEPPIVLSINRHSPTSQNTSNTSVIFRTIFSETVTGVDVSDFILNGSASGMIASVSGSGSVYDIPVNSINGTGSFGLDLKASGTGIADASGNAINSGFTSGQTYNIEIQQSAVGFKSITKLTNLTITSNSTGEKPQSKVWMHEGRHWAVLANSNGTYLWRLDGKQWTSILKLSSKTTSKADCKVVGDIAHIFLYQGRSSQFVSVEYDPANVTYNFWRRRTSTVGLSLDNGIETATIDMDGTGRMWLANAGTTSVYVRWSDAPYSNWSAPITIATGIKDDDICAVVALPGKIGVLWSNQNSERFGFKTHKDGDAPSAWSSDEVPAAQSALNIGNGMADDHMNVTAASDGTLYCAVKTSYETSGYPEIAFLIRRPNGSWDNMYAVASKGTRPIVVLNEARGKVRVVYSATDNGGNIYYNEALTSNISFSSQLMLMSGSSINNPTSTKQTFDPQVVVMASSSTTAMSVLASDDDAIATAIASQKTVQKDVELKADNQDYKVFPNIVRRGEPIQVQSGTGQLTEAAIVDAYGRVIINQRFYTSLSVATDKLQNGTYFITLMEKQNKKVFKFIVVP